MPPVFLDHPRSRVCLAVPSEEHIPLFLKLQNEEISRQYLGRFMPIDEAQEKKWLEHANNQENAVFAIVLKSAKKKLVPIGTMGLHRINFKDRRAITGAMMLEEHCGKGYGSDAKMLLLKWAFLDLGLHKIESRVVAYNGRSQAYSEKCGYQVVATLKEHHFRRGGWQDELVMEVFARDWLPLWEKFEAGAFHKKRPGHKAQTSHSLAHKLEG